MDIKLQIGKRTEGLTSSLHLVAGLTTSLSAAQVKIDEHEEKLKTGGPIDQSLFTTCEKIDTSTNHCCYNSLTLKMFCINKAGADVLGIDTSTAGTCDASAQPCD